MGRLWQPDRPVRPYDWTAPRPLSRPALDATARVLAGWARVTQSHLAPLLRCVARAELDGPVDQQLYAEGIGTLPSPSVLAPLTGPVRGVIQCDFPLAIALLDRLLGGDGSAEEPPRELTELEGLAFRHLLRDWVQQMARVWHDPALDRWALSEQLEARPEYLTVAGEGDWVLLARYHLQVGDRAGAVRWIWPLADLGPLAERAASAALAEEPRHAGLADFPLTGLPVRVQAVLGTLTVTPREWAQLHVGALVPLPTWVGDSVRLRVEGQPWAQARVGQHRQRYTWRIERWESEGGGSDGRDGGTAGDGRAGAMGAVGTESAGVGGSGGALG